MGHIACQCPQHPWNQLLGSRAHAFYDYYKQEEPIQVARTIVVCTLGEGADKYLHKMVDKDNAVKEKLIKKLCLREDFGSA